MDFIKQKDGYSLLLITVQPGARKDQVVGPYGQPVRLKIKIAAPPVEGAANESLIKFLSALLGIPKSKLQILRGEGSRQKDVRVEAAASDLELKMQNIIG